MAAAARRAAIPNEPYLRVRVELVATVRDAIRGGRRAHEQPAAATIAAQAWAGRGGASAQASWRQVPAVSVGRRAQKTTRNPAARSTPRNGVGLDWACGDGDQALR